jgi:GTPase KRas protein
MSVRCIIHKNCQEHGEGVTIAVPGDFSAFLKMASDKLHCKAEKAYSSSGAKIDDVALIREDEKIFISSGEPFFKDKSASAASNARSTRTYKIAVIGSGGVGKSCLSMRYVRDAFLDLYDPTIEDAFRHQTVVDGTAVMLDILDTAGQEDMKMLRKQWIEDRDGFLLVYSINDKGTFDELIYFYDLIVDIKGEKLSQVPLVIVGNKCDLEDEREVPKAEAEQRSNKFSAKYVEASARTGHNVAESFAQLVRGFYKLEPSVKNNKKSCSCCTLL